MKQTEKQIEGKNTIATKILQMAGFSAEKRIKKTYDNAK